MNYSNLTKEDLISKIKKLEKQVLENKDISAKKTAVDDLLKKKNFTDRLINSLPGVFYLASFEEDGAKLLLWNKNHETFSGYSAEELMNKNTLDFFDKEDHPALFESFERILKTGSESIELPVKIKSGKIIPFHFESYFFLIQVRIII
jgi:PAS domain-containing protein